ncbi:head GIN domain-containing protein [uncultured Kriegella sp.]|uniref:head GIN domain-containing protein n=1 Tax=uncultured Kriegella sp. TaxID=1798910 RepID=UPI0030D891A5
MKKLTALVLVTLSISSCTAQWGKKVAGNGNIVTIERTTGDYEEIGVSGWFDVELVDGREGQLTLTGEDNLLEHIVTDVKNGHLSVRVEKGYNLKPSSWKEGIHITIPVESIKSIALSGSGDIIGRKKLKSNNLQVAISGSGDVTLDVETDQISAAMSGSGDMNLSGEASNFEVSISGSGDIEAYELNAENVDASVSGSANINVTAHNRLKARVSGSGDIKYRGNPTKVDTKTSGSGDISKG